MSPERHLRERLHEKLPEILLEAASVVFAILLAFAVEEWRQDRQEARFAERARVAVIAELRANEEELGKSLDAVRQTAESLSRAEAAGSEGSLSNLEVTLVVPELSTAAWRAAQASEAATTIQYDWLLRVARAYEVQELYMQGQQELLRSLAEQSEPADRWLRSFRTRLALSQQVGEQLSQAYGAILQSGDGR